MAVIIIVAAITLPMTAYAVRSNITTLHNSGRVKAVGVGIYSDSSATTPLASISWGIVEPGTSVIKTIYVKNSGNTPVTLSLGANNWSPSAASKYMFLSWDYGGESLAVGQVIKTTLTLSESSSISGITSFSFDIVITSSG